ncbi:MAG TPA: protein tyrosine phosphatase family protein [Rhodocyclaceae bacterium]|nr:protein tyrosine phosphatase family protein [Rhodocyclaceae bacterium]
MVNLALPTSSNALPGVAERVTGLGLAYVQIPVEWEDPLPAQFEAFAGVLAAFRGRRLWVHCAKNMRVSAFVYLYRRLLLGEAEEAAAFPLRTVWTPNPVWQDFMNRIAAAYVRGPQAASARSGQPQG